MIIYIYAYLLYNINQAYIIIPEKSKAGGKRRINCPLPLHFIARSFINPGRELVSRYFTMGAGALVNPRFFDERARSEQLRFSKTPKRSRDHGTGHRQLPAARRLNKGWTLPLPRGLSCLVARTTRFYPRTLAASHGIIGRVAAQVSRFRSVLVEISADFEKGSGKLTRTLC